MRVSSWMSALIVCVAGVAAAGETICVKVVYESCNGQSCRRLTEYGSAVTISEGRTGEWRAMTAAHVLEHATVSNTTVAVDGAWRPVTQIYTVPSAGDAAFLMFRLDREMRVTPTACEDDVSPGTEIIFDGFANGSDYKQVTGTVIETGMAKCTARPVHGQSGGGVYSNGILIGTVTGFDMQTGNLVYEPVGKVRRQCVRQWGFWIGQCPQRQQVAVAPPVKIPSTRIPEFVAPPPPPERPSPPADKPAQPGVTKGDIQQLTDAVVALRSDLAALKSDVQTVKNTQIPVQVLAADGGVYSQETVKLGDPIKLRLVPKVK